MPAIEDDAVLGAGTAAVVAPARAVRPALVPVPPLLAHPASLQGQARQGQARLSYIPGPSPPAGASVDTAGTAHHKSALAIAGPSPGVRDGGMSRAAKGADCKSAGLCLRRFESYFPHHAVSPRDGLCLTRAKWSVFQRLAASLTPLPARPRRGKRAANTASLAASNGFFHFSA
jgi:hypothetical protein